MEPKDCSDFECRETDLQTASLFVVPIMFAVILPFFILAVLWDPTQWRWGIVIPTVGFLLTWWTTLHRTRAIRLRLDSIEFSSFRRTVVVPIRGIRRIIDREWNWGMVEFVTDRRRFYALRTMPGMSVVLDIIRKDRQTVVD